MFGCKAAFLPVKLTQRPAIERRREENECPFGNGGEGSERPGVVTIVAQELSITSRDIAGPAVQVSTGLEVLAVLG